MSAARRGDALAIWHAAVDAVRSDRLVREAVTIDGHRLTIGAESTGAVSIDLTRVRHIEVVGAGKAGAGMAAGIEEALGPRLLAEKTVSGWVNVPADCVRPLSAIHLHASRPPGVNEPRAEGVAGAEEILRRVARLGPEDVCIALISGGASALLPAPVEGLSLEEKIAITRHLSAAGANIVELNTVRKQLSRIKGGGLARACRAGWLASLVISDVLGDPVDIIASGPTVADTSTPVEALEILQRYSAEDVAPMALQLLEGRDPNDVRPAPTCRTTTVVIGNNATAVEAAGVEAIRLGYRVQSHSTTEVEGQAEDVGRHLAVDALRLQSSGEATCLITGGEPVVTLAPSARRGRGGRNQQLALAAFDVLAEYGASDIVFLSGGTDGEDGPTDAAGAIVTDEMIAEARERDLDWRDALRRNDAYTFFDALGGLVKTGPTHTNVCDVRVAVW